MFRENISAAEEMRCVNSAEFLDMSDEMQKFDSLVAKVRKSLITEIMAEYDER